MDYAGPDRAMRLSAFWSALFQVFFIAFPLLPELVANGSFPPEALEDGYHLSTVEEQFFEQSGMRREEVSYLSVFGPVLTLTITGPSKSEISCATTIACF